MTQYPSLVIYVLSARHGRKASTMKMRNYTFRQMVKIIEANGFEYVRCTGDHFIYKKEGERNTITLAKNKHVNPCIARRLIKECNLKVD